jgi:hypothetical protein
MVHAYHGTLMAGPLCAGAVDAWGGNTRALKAGALRKRGAVVAWQGMEVHFVCSLLRKCSHFVLVHALGCENLSLFVQAPQMRSLIPARGCVVAAGS